MNTLNYIFNMGFILLFCCIIVINLPKLSIFAILYVIHFLLFLCSFGKMGITFYLDIQMEWFLISRVDNSMGYNIVFHKDLQIRTFEGSKWTNTELICSAGPIWTVISIWPITWEIRIQYVWDRSTWKDKRIIYNFDVLAES